MRTLRAWAARLGGLFQRERRDRDLDAELESHLLLDVDNGVRNGLTPDEARRQAVLRLRGFERTKEQYRDRRSVPAVETLVRDVRYALRALRQRPGFSAAAIVVLALGIGANTAIFGIVQAVLLRPLPYAQPDRLVSLWHVPPPTAFPGMPRFAVSPANFLDWQQQSRAFERMALMQSRIFTVTGTGEPETLRASAVTPGFFDVLGARPILGRTLRPDEDVPGRNRVVVLSERLWVRRFGGDPGILGRTVTLDGDPFTVVGVMDASFRMPGGAELWTPAAWSAEARAVRSNHTCRVVARLGPGVDLATAQTEMAAISRRLELAYPEDDKDWGAVVVPLHDGLVANIRPTLMILFGAVAFVLLIACANVANLVLARTMGRRKEIGVRLALGASAGRVLRQILCETTVLGVAGGLAGLLVAQAATSLIVAFLSKGLSDGVAIRLDLPTLLFTLLMSVACGLLAGLGAAWRLTRTNVSDALKQGLSRTDADQSGSGTRAALVIVEVALSLMLLVGAGLTIRSLAYLQGPDTGIDPRNVLTGLVPLPGTRYETPEKQQQFFDSVLDRVRALPGVDSASLTNALPLAGEAGLWSIAIEGRPAPPASQQPAVEGVIAAPGLLRTLGIGLSLGPRSGGHRRQGINGVHPDQRVDGPPLLAGAGSDRRAPEAVFVPDSTLQVVGVVKDVKMDGLDGPASVQAMYFSVRQVPNPYMHIVLRTVPSPEALAGPLSRAVHAIDPDQPIVEIKTMEEVTSESIARRRLTMLLLAAFAALAVVLAAVGIYSVLAYTVRQRLREIGIRLALGARPAEVLRMMVLSGMRPTVAGVAIGLAGALALSRLLAGLVFGISSTDPLTFAAVAAIVLVVGLSASLLPAYRATGVDPIQTLRDE